MTRRALITGGAGFIGAWIARRLHRRAMAIRILDLNDDRGAARAIIGDRVDDFEWRRGDVSDATAMLDAARSCDLLVHLAAILTPACQADPVRGAQINLLGTLHAFEAARAHGIATVLYMSSAGVFGPGDGVTPCPTTLYGAYKLAGEGCARAFFDDHGINSVGLRPLVVYGPGRETGLTAGPTLACRAAVRGEPYTIPFGGDSDFVYVDDVAAAFEETACTRIDGAHVYNVVGEHASVDELVEHIKAAVPGARIDAAGGRIPVAANIQEGRLRTDFPAVPRTPLRTGIASTIDHYRGTVRGTAGVHSTGQRETTS